VVEKVKKILEKMDGVQEVRVHVIPFPLVGGGE
jgi:copper chaperone CopZ